MKTGALTLLAAAGAASAQTSPMYMVAFDSDEAVIVQNGVVIQSWNNTGAGNETAMAIHDTVRVLGRNSGETGAEFDLNGNLVQTGVYLNTGYTDVYDGTTDGTYNYGVAHNDSSSNFAVVRGDANWGNLQTFFVPVERSSGIAYDSINNSLWLAENVGGFFSLLEYDLNGNLLQQIDTVDIGGAGYGLAHDPADDTLWISGAFGSGADAHQFDKNGNLIGTIDIGRNTNWISAEIRVPAPGGATLLGLGALAATRRRR